jgi:uncharacterized protein YbjQ (UPF0145 family)
MLDINTIITAAFNQALRPLVERVEELESANSILVMRINTQEQNHRALLTELEKLTNADIRLKTLESQVLLNLPGLDERISALEHTPSQPKVEGAPPMDYFMSKSYTEQFIEHLDMQEWFWNKVNHHVEMTLDRWEEDAHKIDREKVEEIVREFWSEEYENEVTEIAERKAEEAKEEALEEMRDYLRDELDDKVVEAVDRYDMEDKMTDAIDNYDFDSKVEDGIEAYDFSDKLEDAVREALRRVSITLNLG